MPLYEFECSDCGDDFETLVLDPRESVKCRSCESENVSKRFSTFGLGGGSGDSDHLPEAADSGCCVQSSCGCC